MHKETGMLNLMNNCELFKRDLKKGIYLVKVSGIYTNSNGSITQDTLRFEISIPNREPMKVVVATYNNSGYSYPYALSEYVDIDEGELKI